MTTKAKSRGQKLAAKRDRAAAPFDLAPVPRREKQGKARMGEIRDMAIEKDADIPALEARCRQAGIAVITVPAKPKSDADDSPQARKERHQARQARTAQLRDMRAVWRGCAAGRAMASVVIGEAARDDLWGAIQHMRRTVLSYDRALGAPSRHAKCMQIMQPTEAMQADAASPPIDLRTEEEKYRQAISGWMQMHGWLGYVDSTAMSIAIQTVIEDKDCIDQSALVRALHCVSDGVAGRKLVYRGA